MSVISAGASRSVLDRPRLLSLPNGEKLTPMFSREEIDRRLSKLRGWMEEASIDACLFTSIHNVNYFADYVYCSFGRHYGLVVTPDAHSIIGANLDFGRPWRRSFADSVVYTDWHRDNFFVAVRSLCPNRGRIGIELDHVTWAARAKLEAALPDVELVDAGEAAMRVRMIKSAEEHALIRNGAVIADIGGAACVEAIAEDVSEHEVALHATRAMVREIAHPLPARRADGFLGVVSVRVQHRRRAQPGDHAQGGSRRRAEPQLLSDDRGLLPRARAHPVLPSRTGRIAGVVERELRGTQQGYRAHPPRRALHGHRPRAERDLRRAWPARPGTFGYGHSFGTLCHYYGREAGLELREDVETVLVPGMVVSMEPMITVPEGLPGAGGYREHDMLIVTENGAENLTGFPFGPEHNVVGA